MDWLKLQARFVVFDGPDGAGKSTQIQLTQRLLFANHLSAITLRDPGGTRIGDRIRDILLDNAHKEMAVRTEALLYMASRAQLYHEKIAPALAARQCVLCDRWLSSTLAYQAVAGKIGVNAVLAIAEAALERVWPDLIVVIDLPSEVGLERRGDQRDRMEQKSADFHREVRQAFLDLPGRQLCPMVVVDGTGAPETVHQRVQQALADFFDLGGDPASAGLQGK